MGLRINTNIDAINAQKSLSRTDGLLSQSLSRLSSGLRINKSADDASGLAIADTLRAQHTGIGQAVSNANDGINIVQTADLALEESFNIINSIRTKSIQAASDGQNQTSRNAIQSDVNKLLEELDMIGNTTAYNGQNLLDGSFNNKTFHIGAYKDESIKVSIADARTNKIGAMAYAKTARESEAAVSNPFLKGTKVTNEELSDGDIYINNVKIGGATVHSMFLSTGTAAVSINSTTALAKAQAINEKVNESGVQAKATTEVVLTIKAAAGGSLTVNGAAVATAINADQAVSAISNSASFQRMGIRAEKVTSSSFRIIADDGRNLSLTSANSIMMDGTCIAGNTISIKGSLTLSNARAMVTGTNYITSGVINSGDLTINGVDIASGGSLSIKENDYDRTLLNAINSNEQLQKLGIRAETYNPGGGDRLRLISNNQAIIVNGKDSTTVAGLIGGTTEGTKTTGIIVSGNTTDTNTSEDNYLRKIGFDGVRFGSTESSGVNNSPANDIAVIGRSYLTSGKVTSEELSDGDIYINNVKIGGAVAHSLFLSTGAAVTIASTSALAKAQEINEMINDTGVAAKATTEVILTIKTANGGSLMINGAVMTTATNADAAVAAITNSASFQRMGIRAEKVTSSSFRIIADDGRNLSLTSANSIMMDGTCIAGNTVSIKGTLTFTNARAMVAGTGSVASGDIDAGDLIINGVDLASDGSLTVKDNDYDGTLLNAINQNTDLQKLGIRAERYNPGGGERIRLISTSAEITISGTKSSNVAKLTTGTTEGTLTTEIKIKGSATDTNTSEDNYLRKIGLGGTHYGSSEANGANNSGGNDIINFGSDRLAYSTGDITVNGYALGEPTSDGLSDVYADRSAAAWANAINLVSDKTGVEADIIKATETGKAMVKDGTLAQGDVIINGIDIVRDNSGGSGMEIQDGDGDHTLMDAINEYSGTTGVSASINEDGKLVLSAVDGRNIHVKTTSNGNMLTKLGADFGDTGIAQDTVVMGNIRLVSEEAFTLNGSGSSASSREISLLKMGLAGGGANTEATSDAKGDGTIIAGVNYETSLKKLDVTTQEGAELAIRSADFAMNKIDEIRGNLGSTQNQLTSTIANLSATRINIQSSESSIRDVNFAEESSNFSKMQVLMQAGTYALSQANSSSQNVMRLLQ